MDSKGFFGNWIVRNLLLAAGIVAAIVLTVTLLLTFMTRHGKEITVPDMANLTLSEAARVASASGLRVHVADSVFVRRVRRGVVFSQNPKAGSRVKAGRRIHLTMNAQNAKMVRMPSLVGLSMRQAKAELGSLGLTLGRLVYVNDIATNNVLRQTYGGADIAEGTMVESGSAINLVVGLNREDAITYAPVVLGMKYLRAVDAIQESSLNLGKAVFDATVRDYADSINAVVYSQRPSGVNPTSVVMGTDVSISLTLDPSKVPSLDFNSKE